MNVRRLSTLLLLLAGMAGVVLASGCAAPASHVPAGTRPPEPSTALREAARERELSVAFLIGPGVYNTELTAPLDILHHTVFHTTPGMKVFTVAETDDVVTSFEGLRLLPDHTFATCPDADILVVPSAEHHLDTDLENEVLIRFVRETGQRSGMILSLCDGAFVLARAGLLTGLHATTFPSDISRFREFFGDQVIVREGVSFVHDGKAITSIGGADSFAAALYIVELLYGKKAARGVAKGLCIDWSLADVKHVR